jgi:hypothetical protein
MVIRRWVIAIAVCGTLGATASCGGSVSTSDPVHAKVCQDWAAVRSSVENGSGGSFEQLSALERDAAQAVGLDAQWQPVAGAVGNLSADATPTDLRADAAIIDSTCQPSGRLLSGVA